MDTARFISKDEVRYDGVTFIPTNSGHELVSKISDYKSTNPGDFCLMKSAILNFKSKMLNDSMLGFQSETILKVLENSKTSYMTGSFVLWMLNGIYHKKWYPGDIDIFTTDEHFHKKLNKAFNNKFEMYESTEPKYEFVNSTNNEDYVPNRTHIRNIYEWKTKYLNSDCPKKLQVIVVKGDVNKVIDNFDFDVVKARYNGQRLYIPEVTLDCLMGKKTTMISKFSTIPELENTLERSSKYYDRGYPIDFPETIEFPFGITYDYLTTEITQLYHTTKERNILILNDAYKPKEMFKSVMKHLKKLIIKMPCMCPRTINFYGFDFDLYEELEPYRDVLDFYNVQKRPFVVYDKDSLNDGKWYFECLRSEVSKKALNIVYDDDSLGFFKSYNVDDILLEDLQEKLNASNDQLKTYEKILKEFADKVSFIKTDKMSELEENIQKLQNRVKELEEENHDLREMKGSIMNILTK